MLIIFKEKNFALKDKVIKYTIVILLFTLLILAVLNYYLKTRQKNVYAEINEGINMVDKYINLNHSLAVPADDKKVVFSNLLNLLSSYSDNLSYQSLIIDQQKIIINGKTKEKQNIINLVANLKDDDHFIKPELKEISTADNYNFQIETKLR